MSILNHNIYDNVRIRVPSFVSQLESPWAEPQAIKFV